MGDVYLARDPQLDRPVAVKVLRAAVRDPEALDRFFREARAAAALRHPNIVTIYGCGQHHQQPYIVMEYVDGEVLADIIRQRRNLALSDKLSYLAQICAGLHHAHAAGIVHRDVKPANVMVDRQGVVRILDFGIARIEGSAMTLDGMMVGSLNYMSPEQMLGKAVDHRTDVFSVGSVAYELLCYRQAFKGTMTDGLLQRLPNEPPPPLLHLNPDLPPELEGIVMRALEKAPAHRYADLADMQEAITRVAQGLEQDDVRTVVVRPRGRVGGSAPAASPYAGEASFDRTPGAAEAGPEHAFPAHPVWAAPAPTRIASTPDESSPAPPTTRPPSSIERPVSSVTTRTRMAVSSTYAAGAKPSAGPGILLGSVLGACVIIAVSGLPWQPAPAPSTVERERPAIEAAFARFRLAYRNRDMDAMAAAFPTMAVESRAVIQQSFAPCLIYELTFDGVRIELDEADPARATADVHSTHVCTPRSAARPVTTERHDVFSLRKGETAWSIERVVEVRASPAASAR
jgi:serine/threonine protein kinase